MTNFMVIMPSGIIQEISSEEIFPISCPSLNSLASKEYIFSATVSGIKTILVPTITGVTDATSCRDSWKRLPPFRVNNPLQRFPFGHRYSVLATDSLRFRKSLAFQQNENTPSSCRIKVGSALLKCISPRSFCTSPA